MQITFFAQVRDIEAYDFRNLHQIVISKLQNLFGGELIPRKTLIRPHYIASSVFALLPSFFLYLRYFPIMLLYTTW